MRCPVPVAFTLGLCLLAPAARAQPEVFFGKGDPPVYKETEIDRRFAKSRIQRGLSRGSADKHCVELLGGLFALLAEAAPSFHKRDQNFYLDPALVQALGAQLNTPRFPGNAFLAAMVRRVMIDGRLPPAWLSTANALNRTVGIIDMAKLQYLADGPKLLDSFYLTLPALEERYEVEVLRATTAAKATAVLAFRDAYLDRDVAWGHLYLIDIAPAKKEKKRRRRRAKNEEAAEPELLVARLEYRPPRERPQSMGAAIFGGVEKQKPIIVEARLDNRQYVDLKRIPKGKRLLVRGRFWEMSDDLKKLELRGALLFEERDWSRGALLARPQSVALCPMAVNDLAGTAPVQPGGFGMRPGQKHR